MHAILIAGAALVGLPILLHLIMKQEPKRLSFPAFRFLTQKLKTNQRKLRLRHFLLLALRMLLIALFCLALYQPTIVSERLNLSGEQPVAVVLVIDTSPSMGYTVNEKTRLEESCRIASEFLSSIPEKSTVTIVDTGDGIGDRATSVAEAQARLRKITEPIEKARQALNEAVERGASVKEIRDYTRRYDEARIAATSGSLTVTMALGGAYKALETVDAESDTADSGPLPKLVAVFTDRAAAAWEASRNDDLKKVRERIPTPPAHVVFDVGVEQPTNVAILSAEMKPQVIAANQVATVIVTVAATGPATDPPADVVVRAKLDGGDNPDRKGISVPNGQSRALVFEFKNQKPGLHQVEFSLETPDKLAFDNIRYLTFKVGDARRILTITDEPEGAVFWQLAHQAKGEFGCLVVTPEQVKNPEGRTIVEYPNPEKPKDPPIKDDIRAFEVVCLLGVANPDARIGIDSLWDKLRPYVEGGGKLLIIPGREGLSLEGYAAGGNLMPGTLKGVIETRTLQPPPPPQTAPGWEDPRDGKNGVTWFLDDRTIQRPMLRPFQDWKAKGNVDAIKYPRLTQKFWDVQPAEKAVVVVRYNDAEKPDSGHPAVLEQGVPDPKDPKKLKGTVLLLTTRLEVPTKADPAWNDYWETEGSTWFVVFPWLLVRYLAGDTADANFNDPVGQAVTVPLPKGGVPKGTKVILEGPGIAGNDTSIEVGDKQTDLRLDPRLIKQPGNYSLSVQSLNWRDGFSLNVPAEESTLDKVPVEAIEDLTGKNTVVPLDKNRSIDDVMVRITGHPLDLFPWLLIAVLLLLAAEGLIANRFYRRVK